MSEWNLSVRLTGQGSDLSRTLRDVASDARNASEEVNELRGNLALLRAEADNHIRIRLDVDADHLRNDIRDALNTADTGQGLAVNLRLADPMQLRRDVSEAVRWASMNQTVRIRVDPDTSALNGLNATPAAASGGSSSSSGGLLNRLLPIAPAAIPLVAGLSSSVLTLAQNLAIGTTAAGAFGLALAGQVSQLSDVADAQQKYNEAVSEHGAASAEAITAQIAYQKTLAGLPPETQKAAIALADLKQTYRGWSDDMAKFTMAPVTKSFTVLEQILPALSPEVESFSGQLDRLMTVAGGAVNTPGFDHLSAKLADLTDQKLDDFTDQVIHLLRILSDGQPSNGALAQILDYARQNAPAAREALNAFGDAIGTIAEGAADAGPVMLTLVTAAARLVGSLPPELVTIIIQVAAALKLLQLSGAGVVALAGALTRVRAALTALAAASAAAGGGLVGLRAAFLSLGMAARASIIVAGIGLAAVAISKLMQLGREAPPDIDKITGSLARLGKSGRATGELSRVFGQDLDDLYDKVRNITDPSTADNIQNGLVKVFSLGIADSTPWQESRAALDSIDEGLTNLVKGGKADLAAAAYERLKSAYAEGGKDVGEFTKQMDGYKEVLADAKFEQEHAADSMGLFGQAAQDTSAKLAEQKASADGLRQSIVALNDVNRAAGSAMSAFEQSIDDATAAVKEHAGALTMRDGDLDLGSAKAREAEKVLSDLAANTDAAATSAREQGRSWEYVQGIMTRGQDAFVQTAQKMGLTRSQAEALAQSYLKIPSKKSTVLEMRTEDAIVGLESVIAAIKRTPGSKSVTVKALTTDAVALLQDLGFTVTRLPDGRFKVTAETANAKANIAAIQRARDALKGKTIDLTVRDKASAQARAIQNAINAVRGKSVTITTVRQTLNVEATAARNAKNYQASGSVLDFYADGGIQRGGVRHFAGGSERHVAQMAPGGSWRVWAEPETGGEAYIPLAMSKRVRSRAIAEETVRRLGGDPTTIQWNADGTVTDWRYDPQTGSLYSASDAGQAGHKTRKVKTKVKGKWQAKEVEYFDITAVEKKLKSASKATQAWNADLQKVADRVGGDVADALASMGKDGMKLADKMARGSTKYINDMAKALRNLQATAKASLTDYTRQLGKANTVNKKFSADLAKLAGMGYGDLAAQLAEQGDESAQQLAAAAVKDKKKAAAANAQAKTANNALTDDQVQSLVQIIAAIKTSKTGIHDVAATTGIGEDEIIKVANKAKGQISSSLGSRSVRFLSDLSKANKHLAYADGGIRAGMYATSNGIIRFAEPETRGEAYLPLSPSKRRHALPVLADVAHRFGLGLTDAQASRPIVIVRGAGDTNVSVTAVRTGATASDIGAQVGRSVRRARRGGVSARAA